jgi:hypothetical protein
LAENRGSLEGVRERGFKSKIEVFSFVQFIQPLAESKKNEKECSSAATLAATLEP